MVFRRRSMALRPINRIKHVVDNQGATVAGTAVSVILAQSVDAPVLANTDEVITGCTINGIFLVFEAVATSSAALPNMYFMVYKNPGANITFPAPNAVGASDTKKYVIHQEMVMLQKQTGSNPRTIFKGVIAIPRHMRRMAPDDEIDIRFLSPGVTTDWCMQAHYKEFR